MKNLNLEPEIKTNPFSQLVALIESIHAAELSYELACFINSFPARSGMEYVKWTLEDGDCPVSSWIMLLEIKKHFKMLRKD